MKIEVSAIMPSHAMRMPLAITPDGNSVYGYFYCRWQLLPQGFSLWQGDIEQGRRKVYRGIFTIEVKS